MCLEAWQNDEGQRMGCFLWNARYQVLPFVSRNDRQMLRLVHRFFGVLRRERNWREMFSNAFTVFNNDLIVTTTSIFWDEETAWRGILFAVFLEWGSFSTTKFYESMGVSFDLIKKTFNNPLKYDNHFVELFEFSICLFKFNVWHFCFCFLCFFMKKPWIKVKINYLYWKISSERRYKIEKREIL